ncbi:hypothetical protein [Marilutibacter alkalisoli]|uniref:CHAT domain-containing protein n=1 Tax=Marilutibacter alkalisoli TaxID=2591633 RepID=A0A514BVT5_9GAMM|nr:hypothetical protein [Lysobacter alkalisoli]QDH71487.1 hypothetical protein FKV23_16355 [Lysobacter alkalisoli]
MTASFNQILIVDSLPDGEVNTAEHLFEDVRGWAHILGEAPHVVRVRVEAGVEFLALLEQRAALARRDSYAPLLHIECHGSDEGLQFADGSNLTWEAMRPAFVSLNEATRMNLIVVVAACSGSSIASTVQVQDRAPLWAFLAPKQDIGSLALEASLSAFYQTLLATRSAEAALGALRSTEAGLLFMYSSAQTMYRLVVEGYEREHGSAEAIQRQAERLCAMAGQHGFGWSVDQVEALIRDPQIFEGFRRRFFMMDLFPENAHRFQEAAK